MKTTIDVAGSLLRRAKAQARKEGSTLKDLVEEGLQLVLNTRAKRKRYKARPVVFKGRGLAPEFRNAPWSKIRDAACEGRDG